MQSPLSKRAHEEKLPCLKFLPTRRRSDGARSFKLLRGGRASQPVSQPDTCDWMGDVDRLADSLTRKTFSYRTQRNECIS